MIPVDVLTVLKPGASIHEETLSSLERQGYVSVTHQVEVSDRLQPGERREAVIARARNSIKTRGVAHYAFFLDSDVVLPDNGIERLIFALFGQPHHAAMGINYQPEECYGGVHVAMGAVLFYRPILERITFRAVPQTCECFCCCEDLRAMGYWIDYLPGLHAKHLKSLPNQEPISGSR